MKAFVAVLDFGTIAQRLALCATIEKVTGLTVHLGSTGNPVITCEVSRLGEFLGKLAQDETTNWIEYTLQFEG